jgi:GTP:adenosylcobinamide-phosphate guanylyltransferase
MNDTLIIVSGIVIVLSLALWMFKDRLDSFIFKADKKSVTAKMEKHQNTGITISNNTQDGEEHEIIAEKANVNIENNEQLGKKNRISTATPNKKK